VWDLKPFLKCYRSSLNYTIVLRLKKSSVRYDAEVQFFIPLALRSTLNLGIQSATSRTMNWTPNQVFRIGGLHNLRGFDEQAIYASTYYIPRVNTGIW